jgi:hypothetical protein
MPPALGNGSFSTASANALSELDPIPGIDVQRLIGFRHDGPSVLHPGRESDHNTTTAAHRSRRAGKIARENACWPARGRRESGVFGPSGVAAGWNLRTRAIAKSPRGASPGNPWGSWKAGSPCETTSRKGTCLLRPSCVRSRVPSATPARSARSIPRRSSYSRRVPGKPRPHTATATPRTPEVEATLASVARVPLGCRSSGLDRQSDVLASSFFDPMLPIRPSFGRTFIHVRKRGAAKSAHVPTGAPWGKGVGVSQNSAAASSPISSEQRPHHRRVWPRKSPGIPRAGQSRANWSPKLRRRSRIGGESEHHPLGTANRVFLRAIVVLSNGEGGR